jgi:peroxiredoxin
MYRGRSFEFISISVDKEARKTDALNLLRRQEASNKNYIFNDDDVYKLIDAIGNEWQGALPFTLVIEPGGKVIFSKQDMIDPLEVKKLIVDSKFIGRYY